MYKKLLEATNYRSQAFFGFHCYSFIYVFISSFLIRCIPTAPSSSELPTPEIHHSSVSLQKREGLPGIAT